MINTGLQLLNAKELLDANPKVEKKFREFIVSSLQSFQGQLSRGLEGEVEIPKIEPLVKREELEAAITWTPRILLDFFDDNNIHLVIDRANDQWFFSISQVHDGTYYKRRNEAEIAGFNKCFTELESVL